MAWKIDTFLIIAAILGVFGVFVPIFMVPAIILAFIPLLRYFDSARKISSSTALQKRPHFGENSALNENSGKEIKGSTVPFDRSGNSEASDGWSSKPEEGEVSTTVNINVPFLIIPNPWETPSRGFLSYISGISNSSASIDESGEPLNWLGVGDERGRGVRLEFDDVRKMKFQRIGRVLDSHNSDFVSKFDNPSQEETVGFEPIKIPVIHEINANDVIRSGDVVKIYDSTSGKHLTISGFWIDFSDDKFISGKELFQITVLDENGFPQYGVPLLAGKSFRLRSARWPKYEIGCQSKESQDVGGMLLVLYEWTSKLQKGPIQWKGGAGLVNPLNCCIVRESVRSANGDIAAFYSEKSANFSSMGLISGLFGVGQNLKLYAVITGWMEMLHRSTGQLQIVAIIVCSDTPTFKSGTSKRFTCFRTLQELARILRSTNDSFAASNVVSHLTPNDKKMRSFGFALDRLLESESHSTSVASKASSPKEKPRTAGQTLFKILSKPMIFDTWLLTGQSELINQMDITFLASAPTYMTVAVRAVWETHWAEEIVIFYSSYISFYAPNSKKPSLTMHLREIVSVSSIDDSPLPGFFCLRLECVGRVHYLCLNSADSREKLSKHLLNLPLEAEMNTVVISNNNSNDRGNYYPDYFVHKSGQWLPPNRRVLNGRKFSFDCDCSKAASQLKEPWVMSAKLLRDAMQLLFHNGDGSPSGTSTGIPRDLLIAFLDEVSILKMVPLDRIDPNSTEALCFYVNIYHTLLVHARLVLGSPTKTDWATYFTTASYEIGNDVFSLNELEQCVIRGNLNKPKNPSKHMPPLVPIQDDHYRYALYKSDQRINFLLNRGSVSNPDLIFLLTPDNLNNQLQRASRDALVHSISVDFNWRTVTLPKVCEIYRADFGEDSILVLQSCLEYLKKTDLGNDILRLLEQDNRPPTVKFLKFAYETYRKLKLVE